jgi:hypothetical protein
MSDDPFDDGFGDDPFDDAGQSEDVPYQQQDYVRDILADLGVDSYDQIIVQFDDIDPGDLRGQRFDTFEEVILFLNDIGILSFSEVVDMGDEGFGFVVNYGDA